VTKIAISYRRADTEVMAGRIRDRLADRYGGDTVFMDIDDIPYGKDFRTHIFETIVQSDVLLVIVGQRWLGAGRGGTRRIDNETDFVRLEVETALSNAVPIIPVLVGSARMPQPTQLPESLKNLAFLNAANRYRARFPPAYGPSDSRDRSDSGATCDEPRCQRVAR